MPSNNQSDAATLLIVQRKTSSMGCTASLEKLKLKLQAQPLWLQKWQDIGLTFLMIPGYGEVSDSEHSISFRIHL